MQSHKVYSTVMCISLIGIFSGVVAATPPEGSTHGVSEGSTHDMPMGGDREATPQTPIQLSPVQRQMIGVTYGTVERTTLKKIIRAIGRVDFDERRLTDVTFKIGGWVQDLFVDYTGRRVRKGEPLLTLYSPDLVTSQEEYLLALRTRDQLAQSSLPEARNGSQGLVEAARRRLLLWDLTTQQD